MQDTDIITTQTADNRMAFSPSMQAFYDLALNYPNLPDDLIEIDEDTHARLLTAINLGCHIMHDLTPSSPKPSSYHIWQDDGWALGVDKTEIQAKVWERIKEKRHAVTRGGVYLKSVDKWFHTDDSSRTQYLALQILPELPEGLRWKTMDNTWIPMTKEILMELAPAIMMQEQKNFEVAERHKVAMEKLKDPLSYDYSSGWSEIYKI